MYAGIDLSINATGLVLIDDNYKIVQIKLIKSTYVRIEEKFKDIADQIIETIRTPGAKCVAMEDLAVYGIGQRLLQLAGLNYYLRIRMHHVGLHFVMVAPTTLKKYVCGTSKGIKKQQMMLFTFKRWNVELTDDNICDAYGLARMARDMMSSLKRTRQPKR